MHENAEAAILPENTYQAWGLIIALTFQFSVVFTQDENICERSLVSVSLSEE